MKRAFFAVCAQLDENAIFDGDSGNCPEKSILITIK